MSWDAYGGGVTGGTNLSLRNAPHFVFRTNVGVYFGPRHSKAMEHPTIAQPMPTRVQITHRVLAGQMRDCEALTFARILVYDFPDQSENATRYPPSSIWTRKTVSSTYVQKSHVFQSLCYTSRSVQKLLRYDGVDRSGAWPLPVCGVARRHDCIGNQLHQTSRLS